MRIRDWSSDVCSSDLLDLAPFRVKVKTGGGTAGHNGLKSTGAHIGNDFRRVRIGIGHPGHRDRVSPYVLGNYAKAEIDPLADMLGYRKSVVQGKSVSVRVDLGGSLIIKKHINKPQRHTDVIPQTTLIQITKS